MVCATPSAFCTWVSSSTLTSVVSLPSALAATSTSTVRPVPSKLVLSEVSILAVVMTTALPSLMRWGSAWMVPLPAVVVPTS